MSENYENLADKLAPFLWKYLRPGGLVAQIPSGEGALSLHDISGPYHNGTLNNSQAPQFLLTDGTRSLTGNLAVSAGVTIDGVDLSAHAANPEAHHALVTAGTLISVTGQQVGIATGAAYQFIGTGSGTAATWRNVSELAGNGLGATNGVLAVNVAGLGMSVESDAVTLTSSSNPGAAASILASDTSGHLSLVRLSLSDRVRTPLIDTASGNLTIAPAGDVVLNPGGDDVLPEMNYDVNLGALHKKYLTLHAAELWVESLVAQETIATIGGRILVGPTTTLTRDLAVGDTQIYVRHNQMINGDRVYMEAAGKVEFLAITSAATTISATEYRYNVTRNLDGSGANDWFAGDAVFNTGQAGAGFIDLYSVRGVKSASQAGPTIVGNIRNSATYNDWSEAWAIGNLNGLYGYGSNTVGVGLGKYAIGQPNVVIDPVNGVRLRQYNTDMIVLDSSGNSYFAGVMTIGTSGEIRQGTGTLGSNYTGLRIWRDASVGRIAGYNNNTMEWYGGTDGYLYAGAGKTALMRYGLLLQSENFSGGGTWPYSAVGIHAVANVTTPSGNYRGSLMFGTPPGVYANLPRVWMFHYPGTLPASVPVGGGASLPFALMISDDSGNGPWEVWHAGNDGAGSELDADLLDGYHASSFALLSGATFSGNVVPNAASTRNLGSAGAPWLNLYVDNIIAGTISGTSLSGSIWQHDAADMYIRSSSTTARTLYVANPGAGLMHLDVEGNITLGGTVDGVDVSAHASDVNAHHARDHVLATNTGLGATHTISGATAGHVLRASGATTAAFAAIQDGDLPNTIVRTTRQVIAGIGLAGGGDLTADRTISLGTPSNLSATTTNSVSGTTHTHAILTAAAVSLSATTTNTVGTSSSLARADHTHSIATATAVTLTVASTNTAGSSSSLARADHTHAITSSSNPGAAASILASNANGYLRLVRLGLGMDPTRPLDVAGDAGVSGQVSAGSGSISGALTVGGDFTVGANVLYVNQAGTRVGINRAPDQQFDLDVAGAIRGQYLVGRHAIQLTSALGVWHFDGPAPYNLDYSGSSASHTGLSGSESGHVIYCQGKFGKALQFSHSTTNLVANPSFEVNVTDFWFDNGTQTTTRENGGVYGEYYRKTVANANGRNFYTNAITVANNTKFSISFYYRSSFTTQYRVFEYGTNTTLITQSLPPVSVWTRVYATVTTPSSGSSNIRLIFDLNNGQSIDLDAVQVEQRDFVSPYHDGSLTTPSSWNGTAHNSTSSRTGNNLTYPNLVNTEEGTVMMWAYISDPSTNSSGLFLAGTPYLDAYLSGNTNHVVFRQGSVSLWGPQIASREWVHLAFTWSKSENIRRIFVNGVESVSRQYDDATTPTALMRLGGLSSNTLYNLNGWLDEFVLLDYSADPKLIRAIYESDAPVFVESSVFHWRSPSRVPIWVDEFGFWARSVSGNEILGLYGGDPRNPTGNVTRSWGGITMEENDIVIGRTAGGYMFWDDSAQTMNLKGTMVIDGNSYLNGVVTIAPDGELRQGTGTLGSNYTGLRIWRDGNIGRIGGYNANTLEWHAGTDGRIYAGGGAVAINRYGYMISTSNFTGGGTWPFSFAGLHAVADVASPVSNYRGSLMFGQPLGVFTDIPRVWHFHYPGTLPTFTPTGGGASWEYALSISDDTKTEVVWHSGNDSELAKLSGATFSGPLRVSGDGGGAASTVGFSNVSNLAANSTGVGTILMKGTTSRNSAGFIKIYIGTTAYYVPVFSAITG